jgi:two-component system, OmpR family, phosphate regulon sensor histidine kinase PhoR
MIRKKNIQMMIGLMGLAVLALLGFQWYWINNAIDLRQEQFNLKVTDAMQEVVRKLERQEMIYLMRQREEAEKQRQKFEAMSRTRVAKRNSYTTRPLTEKYASMSPESPLTVVIDNHNSDALVPRTRPFTEGQATMMRYEVLQQEWVESGDIGQVIQIGKINDRIVNGLLERMAVGLQIRRNDSLMIKASSIKLRKMLEGSFAKKYAEAASMPAQAETKVDHTAIEKARQKAETIKDVLKELMFSKRPVEQRMSRLVLDSLLKKALAERGIPIPYQFSVESAAQKTIFSTVSYHPDTSAATLYRATLFPNEINSMPDYLQLYFPDSQGFMLKNMTSTLAGSGLLLLLMMGCFYAAATTIVRQKKLADTKNDFINNMTHEFKTPISTIGLATELAQEQISDPERLKRYLGIVRDENQRLAGHVEKVLQMALLDRGNLKLAFTKVNVHDMIDKVLNNLSVQIEKQEGELLLEFEATAEIVEADELHFANIISNLIDNALKYSINQPQIHISTRSDAQKVYLSVSDKGLGMSKDQLNKIFDQFYRVPTGNVHDVKGFGLGLSYVKKMIEAHGGTIEVWSKIGEGSTFTITMPVAGDG